MLARNIGVTGATLTRNIVARNIGVLARNVGDAGAQHRWCWRAMGRLGRHGSSTADGARDGDAAAPHISTQGVAPARIGTVRGSR